MLTDIKVPLLAESVSEATLLTWHKNVGDHVKKGDSLIDIETDKVTLEVIALDNGIIKEIVKQDGETVHSDEVIARLEATKTADNTNTSTEDAKQQSLLEEELDVKDIEQTDIKLSPAVRNMLEEHKLDASTISTKKDRVTKEDILEHLEKDKGLSKTEDKNAPPPTVNTSTTNRPEERVPMTRLRKRAAERLLHAQKENAILTTFNEINMKPIMDIRKQYKEEFEKTHNIKLGFMSFFANAVVEALKKFPIINASIDGENIIYHGYFDIGIAISSPRGLVVPIIRDIDKMSLADIEKNIMNYGEKSKTGKLTIDDLTGGTFTITNGGVFGSLLSTPIINPPQSAILGMHSIQQRPIAEDGNVVIRPMMYVALSYDHRIIDGRDAVQFLVSIKKQIEEPARLLLQV